MMAKGSASFRRLKGPTNRLSRWLLLLTFLFGGFHHSTWANDDFQQLLFIASKKSAPYTNIIRQVQQQLPPHIKHKTVYSNQLTNHALPGFADIDIIIALGTKATSQAIASNATSQPQLTPIVATLITEQAFSKLKQKERQHNPRINFQKVVLFPIDQPIERFVLLAKNIMPTANSLGIMIGPNTQPHVDRITTKAKSLFAKVSSSKIGVNDNPIHSLGPTIKSSDIFIALPDKQNINLATSKWILQLGQRNRVPIIAFSQKYTQAGALASIYYSPNDIAKSISSWIKNPGHKIQPFTVGINRNVAKALRLQLKDAAVYAALIEEQERQQ